MKSHSFKLALLFLLVFVGCTGDKPQYENSNISDFNALSEQFLGDIKLGKSTEKIQEQLANTTLKDLEAGLQTDTQKLAFWINVYNAYIQVFLSENPELYKDRDAFFDEERILIAGEKRSFSLIEHGIIRKSQFLYGLGYLTNWFPSDFESTLRVDEPDYRIHFALNCGAKDCPPVAIYEVDRLNEQLDKGESAFLKMKTNYIEKDKTAEITSLFSWFRGDFDGESGTKDILLKHKLIPDADVDLEFVDYDWTLELDNWTEL